MHRFIFTLALLPFATGCSLITDLLSDRNAEVIVDATIQQRVTLYATGDTLFNRPSVDPAKIACNVSSPRACYVSEFVLVTVVNDGPEPLIYSQGCPPPFERRENGIWRGFATITVCSASLFRSEIAPGERAAFPIALLSTAAYDWRTSQDEFRIVLRLSDEDGDLPLSMRTSAPFRLKIQ